jgi:uroporphyrinogen-III decarboxylase
MGTSIQRIDPDACCAGHLSGAGLSGRIISFPRGFVTEAEALGAVIHRSPAGLETAQYLFEEPGALLKVPRLAEGKAVRRVLKQICGAPKNKTLLLKAGGPYSILASLIDPKHFYRWLIKHRSAIHHALDEITRGLTDYLCAAAARGVSIISLADPYANLSVVGEKHYHEFAAPYLAALIKNIAFKIDEAAEKPKLIIHLCPHSSIPLARLGYTHTENIAVKHAFYINALIEPSDFPPGLTILGDQCIYARNTEKLAVHHFNTNCRGDHSSFI